MMALHETDSLIIETATVSETLPDPTTASARCHDLSNALGSAVVWGSTGALPFQVDGVGVATLTVPAGARARVQSNGTRWVLVRDIGTRPSFAATAVTNASGDATLAIPPGLFAVTPVAAVSFQGAASNNPVDCRITSVTTTSVTVNVRQSPIVVVLSLSVVGASAPLVGATVHFLLTPPGASS